MVGLLPDFAIVNLLDDSTKGSETNTTAFCTGCKGKQTAAVAKCYDCSNYLCTHCVMAHQLMHCFAGRYLLCLFLVSRDGSVGSVSRAIV